MIPNEHQQVILVQAPNGAFLPGGEIEPGESKEETIKRELVEEVGFAGKIASYLGEAVDYFTRDIEKRITIIRPIFI